MTFLEVIELIAVSTALLYVFLVTRELAICFIFGLISSALYIYICIYSKYYYDAFINLYYVVMSVYGLIVWNKTNNNEVVIGKLEYSEIRNYLFLGTILTLIFGFLGLYVLNSSLPFLDAFTTVFSLIATYLVVKKKIENWLVWIVVDAIGIGMYWYKDLNATAILYTIYTIIAIFGFFSWKRKLIGVN